MKQTYKAKNISCINCSNLIKASLEDSFGEIEVNLKPDPKEVTVEIKNKEQEEDFFEEMKSLGFEIIS